MWRRSISALWVLLLFVGHSVLSAAVLAQSLPNGVRDSCFVCRCLALGALPLFVCHSVLCAALRLLHHASSTTMWRLCVKMVCATCFGYVSVLTYITLCLTERGRKHVCVRICGVSTS